jgi:Zn-dependent protease with chaperone function
VHRAGKHAAATRCATIEIAVHLAVLAFVLLPILVLVFPGWLGAVGVTMLVAGFVPDSILSDWIHRHNGVPLVLVTCMATLAIAVCGMAWSARQRQDQAVKLRTPGGSDGQKLRDIVAGLWAGLAGSRAPPEVRWFPSMDIAAYARHGAAGPELQVSAGLWRAAVAGEPVAHAILAHEIAHILFRDPRTLRWLAHVIVAARVVMGLMTAAAAVTVGAVLYLETGKILEAGGGFGAVLLKWAQVLGAACIVLVLLPLCWLALRRQVAFITSLIEIRADIAGATWTGGLEQFTQIFADSENVVRSSHRSLLVAMLSMDLTHIPQRERLDILKTPAAIVTPKLRFFALSLLLVFLLPLNFGTPLLAGGAFNYLAMATMSIALNVAIVAMLVTGLDAAPPIRLPVRRRIVLAAASCAVTALPTVNLEPLSYLVMSWLAGFGGAPMDWAQLAHDTRITGHDIATKFGNVLFNPLTVLAIAAGYIAITCLAVARRRRPAFTAAAIVATGIATLIAGADPRMPLRSALDSWIDPILAAPERACLLCLPLAAAALVHLAGLASDQMA